MRELHSNKIGSHDRYHDNYGTNSIYVSTAQSTVVEETINVSSPQHGREMEKSLSEYKSRVANLQSQLGEVCDTLCGYLSFNDDTYNDDVFIHTIDVPLF